MSSQTAPVSLRELQAPLGNKLDEVLSELHRIVRSDFQLIAEVNSHLFQMRGKMFRPTLLLLAAVLIVAALLSVVAHVESPSRSNVLAQVIVEPVATGEVLISAPAAPRFAAPSGSRSVSSSSTST